jgi:hypothetical protein
LTVGVDWARGRLKEPVDRDRLEALIEQQATSFQSIWSLFSRATTDIDPLRPRLMERIHLPAYLAASNSLSALFSFADWDDDKNCPADHPELRSGFRISALVHNDIFPPLWRVRAIRTILTDQILDQIQHWRTWTDQVIDGVHDAYLRELYLFETSDFLHYHWSYLLGCATQAIEREPSADWVKDVELLAIRETILNFGEPVVPYARIDPDDKPRDDSEISEEDCRSLSEEVAKLLQLTRDWNARVPKSWQVPDYESNYSLTFEIFKNLARDPWLMEFFEWAESCAHQGFSLYLEG